MEYYAQPTSSDTGVYLTSAEILEKINGGIKKPLSNQRIGKVMKKLDFPLKRIRGVNKYYVKELQYADIQEIKSREVLMEDSSAF